MWFHPTSWRPHQEQLATRLTSLLSRISAAALSGPNKLRVWNWSAPGLLAYSAPFADLGDLPWLFDRLACQATKRWLGLHPSVSSEALFTPVDLGGWGLISLRDTVEARRAAFLLRRRVGSSAYPLVWQNLLSLLRRRWEAKDDSLRLSGRGLWFSRCMAAWELLRIESDPAYSTRFVKEAWWMGQSPFLRSAMARQADMPLQLYVDGSADSGKAAWAVVDMAAGKVVSGRVWGVQNNYRAELCAIYTALRLTPITSPVVIWSDSFSAIQAISKCVDGGRVKLDAPAASLVRACAARIKRRPVAAQASLFWIKAHAGDSGNTAADKAAKAALRHRFIPLPAEFVVDGGFCMDGVPLESDWLEALSAELLDRRMQDLARDRQSGEFFLSTVDPSLWRAAKLPEISRSFVFRARSHALATARRAHLYFPADAKLVSVTCPLCKAGKADTATHWYSCAALTAKWKEEFDKLILRKHVVPDEAGGHWMALAPRENLAWGLLPKQLAGGRGGSRTAAAVVEACRSVWLHRQKLWTDLDRRGAPMEPSAWMSRRHDLLVRRDSLSDRRGDAEERRIWQWSDP